MRSFRAIVAGLGVQGHKRRKFAGGDFVASVDPVNPEADYKSVQDLDPESYDAVLCCTPDTAKVELIHYLLEKGKHVLVEKPLWAPNEETLLQLETKARASNVLVYTAYNHRFEPHWVSARNIIQSGELGTIYRCRAFYGNGTARLVKESAWRDKGSGVLHDLGSHLLDLVDFWFGEKEDPFRIVSSNCFENRAPDHVVIASTSCRPELEFEMTLLSWRNDFVCDIYADKGSLHLQSLCKWGPSRLTQRRRVLPSGRPEEHEVVIVRDDPTWALEYAHFKELCAKKAVTDLSRDIRINRVLRELSAASLQGKSS